MRNFIAGVVAFLITLLMLLWIPFTLVMVYKAIEFIYETIF